MNQFGLTQEEMKTHLQQYNHALFRNSLSFMDIVWEINLRYGTVFILEDKADPSQTGAEKPYEQFFADCAAHRVAENDRELFCRYLSCGSVRALSEETSFTLRMRSADGRYDLYRVVLTPAPDEDGRPCCVYMGALDLHETEQRALAEHRSQQQFREALMANSYFHFDLDVTAGGLITRDYQARDGSYPIRESTGMAPPVPYEVWVNKWYELYEPVFDRQEEKNIFSVDYFQRAFARSERLLDVEVKQKRQHGGGIEYMHIFVVLTEDPADHHIHACVIWRDITPFRQSVIESKLSLQSAAEELKRTVSQEEQFRLASLSGALMIYNINLTKNLIEEEFFEIVDGKSYPMLQMVGLTAPCNFETFCQRWAQNKVSAESRETFLQMYNRQYLLDAYRRGEYQLEIEFDTVIGRGIPVALRNTALLVKDNDSGDIIATISGKDVTRQREEEHRKREALRAAYQAANRANRAKSDFLSRMSHDIRTPMNAIIGMTAIAQTHLDDRERLADCLNKITVSSRHLLGLINEVLDMSKIESGKIDLQEEAFILPDLVESLLDMCRPQINQREHELLVSIRGIEHEKVIGDSQRIRQAFSNLMSNAVKYTPNGGTIRLTITEKPTNKPNIGCYEFVFEDNGIGMSREFLAHLFEPFERAEDPRARQEQGTGLGMAITRNIVQMMNGAIKVESELDKGTRFTVTIFLKLQEQGRDADSIRFADLSVLVADDDELACETTCEMLKEIGIQSEWVLSGQQAVERITARHTQQNDYYAVILDWKMPGMDGVATTREIRRRVGDQIPIIILSAYDWSDIEEEARAVGANGFIGKPLFKSRMICLFQELLGQAETEDQKTALQELADEDFGGRRALLVEDNDLNAEITQEIFGIIDLAVERVCDGREAVERMRQVPDGYYDVIFMDIQMPVMNGYQAAAAIRAMGRPYTGRVPIIAMTANAFAEDVQAARAAGMNEHIAKPLDFDRLKQVLVQTLLRDGRP